MECRIYDESVAEAAEDIRNMEMDGWTTKVVGYEHRHILFFLDTDIVVCYEKNRSKNVQAQKRPESANLESAGWK